MDEILWPLNLINLLLKSENDTLKIVSTINFYFFIIKIHTDRECAICRDFRRSAIYNLRLR
jgi:hypothetical protein